MLVSTRRAIQYPNPTRADAPDIPAHFLNLINALDLDIPFYTGLDSAKPTPTYSGALYWATDTSLLYFWNGAAWVALASKVSPALTGNPTAPTPAITDSSTSIATTQFVRNIIPAGLGPLPYSGASAPSGWYLCDGSTKSRTTDAALFGVIGTVFGAGDGSTTFNLPDMRGRVPVGKNVGTFATLGATGGEETHVLASGEMPSHTHTGTTGGRSAAHTHSGTTGGESVSHTHTYLQASAVLPVTSGTGSGGQGATFANQPTSIDSQDHTHGFSTGTESSDHTHSFTTAATGGGAAHNNLQPYQVVNYVIKA